MAARKPLFMGAEGYSEEMAVSDSITLGGLTMGGDIVMGGNKITGLGLAILDGDAASKAYVDSVAQSLKIKDPVKALATSNVTTLSGTTTIDGVALSVGDRVLLVGQTNPIQNGVWEVQSGSWTRPTDFNTGDGASGSFCFVEQGTAYADTGWVCTTDSPSDVIGTDSLSFAQFSAAGVITAGDGLQKVGQEISAKKGDGIELSSNGAAINVDLAATPGLQFVGASPNGELAVLADPSGGLEVIAAGVTVKLSGTTLSKGSAGLKVIGLPALFQINGIAVGAAVTAPNLDTLTNGSNADALHMHGSQPATEAPKVENSLAVSEAVLVGDPVYFTGTNDRIGRGDTVDSKAKIIGVARTAQPTVGNTSEVVTTGVASSVLSGATSGVPYYLADGGGLSTSLPGVGKRVIQVGIAKNTTDLWVRIIDYGKKAA